MIWMYSFLIHEASNYAQVIEKYPTIFNTQTLQSFGDSYNALGIGTCSDSFVNDVHIALDERVATSIESMFATEYPAYIESGKGKCNFRMMLSRHDS